MSRVGYDTVLFVAGHAENAALGDGLLDPGTSVLTKPFAISVPGRRPHAMIDSA